MGRISWYKRDPDAALSGMFELTLEERGAYNTVLDLIYSRANELPDDDRWIAGWLRVDVRVWKRIKRVLIERGKLYLDEGTIRNARADVEVLSALSRVTSAQEAGLTSARSRGRSQPGSKAPKSEAQSNENSNIGSTAVATPAPTDDPTTVPTAVRTILQPQPDSVLANANTAASEADLRHGFSLDTPPAAPPKKAPPDLTAIDVMKVIFDTGVSILVAADIPPARARSTIGRWCKHYGEPAVLHVLSQAQVKQPHEPIAWITAALTASKEKHSEPRTDDDQPERTQGSTGAAAFAALAELERRRCETAPEGDTGSRAGDQRDQRGIEHWDRQ